MIMLASPAHAPFIFMTRFFFETSVLSLSVVSIKSKNYLFQHTPSFYRHIVINILNFFTTIPFHFPFPFYLVVVLYSTFSVSISVHPMITLLNFLNRLPCKGFVKKSANICPVGQYVISTSPLSTLSLMKKYLILTCLEFPVHDVRPFTSIFMAL